MMWISENGNYRRKEAADILELCSLKTAFQKPEFTGTFMSGCEGWTAQDCVLLCLRAAVPRIG